MNEQQCAIAVWVLYLGEEWEKMGTRWERDEAGKFGKARLSATPSQSLLPGATPLQRLPEWGHPVSSTSPPVQRQKILLRG